MTAFVRHKMTVGSIPSSKKRGKGREEEEIEATTTYKPHQADLPLHARITT